MTQGYLDSVSEGILHGWAQNENTPGQPIAVSVHCDGTPIGTTVASLHRPDLKEAGMDEGNYGFAFQIPDGLEGKLTVWVDGTLLAGAIRAPYLLSEPGPHQRYLLAKHYLRGEGIEIGALDKPMRAPAGAQIRTVDRLPTEELRKHYALPDAISVDYVCDAHKLETVTTASQDFVIANHVFEHMENPIAALENWVRVLRPGGFVFLAIPDKRFTFDVDRPVTPLAHLLEEYHDPQKVEANRRMHYQDWIRLVEHREADMEARLAFLLNIQYAIHFHCWSGRELIELFENVVWLGYELDCYKFNRPEVILILRKI